MKITVSVRMNTDNTFSAQIDTPLLDKKENIQNATAVEIGEAVTKYIEQATLENKLYKGTC